MKTDLCLGMQRMNFHAVAADILLVSHTLFVLFVTLGLALIVAGGLRGWAWVTNPWFRLSHLLAIGVVVLQAWLGRSCPLTTWEMALRIRGGEQAYQSTFISYWLGRVLYYDAPEWLFVVAYTLFAALVLLCWYWVRPRI